jgi:exodeoxyribonuclease VII large subunit
MNTADFSKSPASTRQIWAVGALCLAVSDALSARFNPVAVQGEVSGFTRASSGHCYFTLKDAGGQLRCAFFKRAAQTLTRELKDGDEIVAEGRLGVYSARGELQLVVESVRLKGRGNLFEEFLRIKALLESEGLFDPSLKRALAPNPKGIGVVTSLQAAALHDVLSALKRRVPHIPVVVANSAVQGAQAPQALMASLQSLYARDDLEVILLVRGGGSMEDLWCFNDEQLARVIRSSPVPLVSGVGHETDFTIADFCADLRAPTPTAAAELCAVSREVLLDSLEGLGDDLTQAMQSGLDARSQTLDRLQGRLGRPSSLLSKQQARLALLHQRLLPSLRRSTKESEHGLAQLTERHDRAWREALLGKQRVLEQAGLRLGLLDPSLVLDRGYAWLSDASGQAIVDGGRALSPGEHIHATLSTTRLDLKVLAVQNREN